MYAIRSYYVSVRETKAEISTAPATTTANSLNKRPVSPCKKIIGKKTTAKVMVVLTMANIV